MEDEPEGRSRRRLRYTLLIFAAVLAGGLAAAFLLPRIRSRQEPIQASSSLPVVTVVRPQTLSLTTRVSGTAVVLPRREIPVSTPQAGWLREMRVKVGDRVKAEQSIGAVQVIATASDNVVRAYQSAAERARAAQLEAARAEGVLAQARTSLVEAQSRLESANQEKTAADAAVRQRTAAWDDAAAVVRQRSEDVERMQSLYNQGIISRVEFEQTQSERSVAASEENRLRLALEEAHQEQEAASERIEQERQAVEQARPAVEQAQSRLEAARRLSAQRTAQARETQRKLSAQSAGPLVQLRAPIDGVVIETPAEAGVLVTPGALIAKVKQSGIAPVVFEPKPSDSPRVKQGQTAVIQIPGRRQQLDGRVVAVVPATNGGVQVLIRTPDAAQALTPGLRTQAHVLIGKTNVLAAPKSAVTSSGGGFTVWVVEDGVAHAREVKIMQTTGERVLVGSGLDPDDQLVVSSTRPPREGAPVRIRG